MSMTLSGRSGFLVLRMSEQMRDRLTPAMACSTAMRFLANRLLKGLFFFGVLEWFGLRNGVSTSEWGCV